MKTEGKKNGNKANKNEETAKLDASRIKDAAQKEEKGETQGSGGKDAIAELTESLQRLQAEFENYKKKVQKEKQEFVKYANADLIIRILSTIDTFEIALRNTDDHEKFLKGMEMIYSQLMSTLESEGLKPINAIGKKFDPYSHEVMLKQKSDKEEGIILEELQKGYMLNDKVLRYSKVKVSEKMQEQK